MNCPFQTSAKIQTIAPRENGEIRHDKNTWKKLDYSLLCNKSSYVAI